MNEEEFEKYKHRGMKIYKMEIKTILIITGVIFLIIFCFFIACLIGAAITGI